MKIAANFSHSSPVCSLDLSHDDSDKITQPKQKTSEIKSIDNKKFSSLIAVGGSSKS